MAEEGMSTSDVVGIVVGIVSAIIALVGVFIAYCTWQNPKSPAGRLGTSISKYLPVHSIRGGDGRGGHATGPGAVGGSGVGGSVYTNSTKKFGRDLGSARGYRDIERQAGTMSESQPDSDIRQVRDVRGLEARGGDGIGGSATTWS